MMESVAQIAARDHPPRVEKATCRSLSVANLRLIDGAAGQFDTSTSTTVCAGPHRHVRVLRIGGVEPRRTLGLRQIDLPEFAERRRAGEDVVDRSAF
jgi:hypothetical protein